MQNQNSVNKFLTAAGVLLMIAPLQSSTSKNAGLMNNDVGGFFGEQAIVQKSSDNNNTDKELNVFLSANTLVVSFENEKRLISLMEMASSVEDVDPVLDNKIRGLLTDIDLFLGTMDYIGVNKNDDWLVLLAKYYSNLISDRSPKLIARLIDECFKSVNDSTKSYGIDLLSLHTSYPECRKFLKKSFNHPFLQKKMELLNKEVSF